jgi:NADH:ubiquinone oxidoreductase subunit 3 (subunit A)
LWEKVVESIFLILILSVFIGILLYWISSKISPPGKKTPGKLAPYACGEDVPPLRLQVNIERFYLYTVFFVIFHILAWIYVTSLARPGIGPTIFITMILMFILPLIDLLR